MNEKSRILFIRPIGAVIGREISTQMRRRRADNFIVVINPITGGQQAMLQNSVLVVNRLAHRSYSNSISRVRWTR